MDSKPQDDHKPAISGEVVGLDINLVAISTEIGWKLALPLVVFMLIGIWLDRSLHTTPLFILLAIALSMTSSVILIARMIARLNQFRRGRR